VAAFSLSKTWNVAKLTSVISSSYSCLLAGTELAPFMPLIEADAPRRSKAGGKASKSANYTSVVSKIFDTKKKRTTICRFAATFARPPYGPKKLSMVGKRSVPAMQFER
jgi:hypothetical protein